MKRLRMLPSAHLLTRRVLQPIWFCFLSLTGLVLGATPPPNIILMIADDLAWEDSSPYGHPTLRTPSLQRLADQGMRFDRAILTASSCSPSRASMITGRYPHRTGAEQLHWPVPADQVTFVEKLREAGYWTAAAGKWHLGDALKDRFDEIRETDTSGFQLPAGQAGLAGKFRETAIGDAKSGCDQWVPLLKARPSNKPFFLWLAALDPHRPYDEDILKRNYTPEEVVVPPYLPDVPEVRKDLSLYYNEITRLDRFVGEVLDELDRQGVAENTMVVFLSDNGRPFPRDKTTLYDGGIRTPLFVRWPGRVATGSSSDQLISSVDLAPGFLEAAGVPLPSSLDGVSFLPLLTRPHVPIRSHAFAERHWHDYEAWERSVRSLHFKYILNAYPDLPNTPPADGVRGPAFQAMIRELHAGRLQPWQTTCFVVPRPREELYATDLDPQELRNLAMDPAHATVLESHRRALAEWTRATQDQLPEHRTPDDFDRVTGLPTPARIRPRPSKQAYENAWKAANGNESRMIEILKAQP